MIMRSCVLQALENMDFSWTQEKTTSPADPRAEGAEYKSASWKRKTVLGGAALGERLQGEMGLCI